jgi:hypothetical protein
VGPFMTFHVLVVEPYFPNMEWLDIKAIVRLIKFSFEIALQVFLSFHWPPSFA